MAITDHKPLVHMFSQVSEKAFARQQRQVSYILQFTTDIAYVPGPENLVVDSLSRVETIQLPTDFSLLELAQAQAEDEELKKLIDDPE